MLKERREKNCRCPGGNQCSNRTKKRRRIVETPARYSHDVLFDVLLKQQEQDDDYDDGEEEEEEEVQVRRKNVSV